MELPHDIANSLFNIHPKELKTVTQTSLCTQYSLQHYFTVPKGNIQSVDKWVNRCGVSLLWNIIQSEKGIN